MRLPCLILTAVVLLVALAAPASACLWDYDTLRDEQRGLPTVAAVLAGNWERHSDFFYEQRVEQMRAHLAEHPDDLAAIDNLAVALEKLGRTDEAIELMQDKLELSDEGPHPHYTTHANLGTFFLHRWGSSGEIDDLDSGIEHIESALEINPDAHFGRERYQLQVARYIRRAQNDPSAFDRGSFALPELLGESSQAQLEEYLQESESEDERVESLVVATMHLRMPQSVSEERENELQPAIKGIVGMIRFGTGTSPHLYYALGDLLAARGDKHLAIRAYLRALEFDHPRPEQVQVAIDMVVEQIHGETLADIEAALAVEKHEASQWVDAYQAYEDALLRAGKDVNDEASYADFYARHGQARPQLGFTLGDYLPRDPTARALAFLGGGAVVFVLLMVMITVVRFRRRSSRAGAFATR